jgi:hypothetical protein
MNSASFDFVFVLSNFASGIGYSTRVAEKDPDAFGMALPSFNFHVPIILPELTVPVTFIGPSVDSQLKLPFSI